MAFINYLIHLAILICIYSILTISLNFSVGFTGLLNLGHVGFFGIGAYTSALMALNGIPIWQSILSGGFFAMISGILLALPTMRLKGDYLALATLGFMFIIGSVARNWTEITRGALGIPGIPKIVRNNTEFLIIVFAIVILTYLIFLFISRTRFGKTCQAIRDDETAVAVLGKNTYFYKVMSISISTFFAGIAGSLFVHHINFIDPTVFDLEFFIFVISMLIAGGLASLKGSVVGVFALSIISEAMRYIVVSPSLIGAVRDMAYVVILILILIFKPRGIFGKVDV